MEEGRRSVRQSGRFARRFRHTGVHIGSWADEHPTDNYLALADGLEAELADLATAPVAFVPPRDTNRPLRRWARCPGLRSRIMRRFLEALFTSRLLPRAPPQANERAVLIMLGWLDDIHGRGDLGFSVVYEVRLFRRIHRHG
ncbi:hypothetical protein VTN77DRAFT_3923 [Rasamsonia byssochlamydoides]|uniref:uncharacterized protein n=1 Tax=Rasamsonia byssochlamydoides TaxID=89139 RepID=UPI003742D86B